MIRTGFGLFYSQIFSDPGVQVLFPGYTISQSFDSLGTGVRQPFSLTEGMPLVAVQIRRIRRRRSASSGRPIRLRAPRSSPRLGPCPVPRSGTSVCSVA